MKRYAKVTRSAAGKTVVKITLVDGELSSSYSAVTYTGKVAEASRVAEKYARENMDQLKEGSGDV